METTDFANFETWAGSQHGSRQPTSPSPPRPPPRDLNPFGEPVSEPYNAAENGVVSPEDALDDAPPRPSTPPPPPPIPPKNTANDDGTDNNSSSGASSSAGHWVSSDAPEGGPHASPPSPPMSPLPPQSLPPPPPVVEEAGGGAGGEALDRGASSRMIGRRKALDDTRLFEQRRNHHFGKKFDGDSLYWKCFVELIRRSQANNRRAINYATQKLSASSAYAKSLYAIRDRVDGLDVGTTEAHCEKERKKKGAKAWPPPPLPARDVPKESTFASDEGSTTPRPASALDSLFAMEEHTAMRTLDMVDDAKATVIDKRLRAMVKSLDDRFSEMVGQGTACLRIMHSAEANSAKAYARYSDTVLASLEREEATAARAVLTSRDVGSSDVWLADMNYRVAVTQQARVWRGVSGKLGELFAKMKDVEVERRQSIQGGLSALMQLQDALLRDLPVLKDAVLQSLERINLDRQLLDQEVRQEMRRGAARLVARQEDGGSAGAEGGSVTGGGRSSGTADGLGEVEVPDASQALPPDFLSSIESPLDSSLIARSTMLERKDKMMLASRWVLVLAILTHDSYLLMFDVPKGGVAHKRQLHARTSEAFAELVPKPEVDTLAVELGKHLKDGKGLDSSGLPVPPSVAVDLSACQVSFKPDGKNDATFEILEIKPARGMRGVFKDYDETKFTLRGRSQEAMVDWVCEIKEMGRAGMQAVSSGKKGK